MLGPNVGIHHQLCLFMFMNPRFLREHIPVQLEYINRFTVELIPGMRE